MIRARTSRFARIERKSSSGCGSSSRPESPCGSAAQAGDNKSAAPAEQRSDPAEQERQRRADGERTDVPSRNAGTGCLFDAKRERPQAWHIHARHRDAGQSAESERREQTVAQPHAHAGQRAEYARGEIELPAGPPVGQADQRDDGEHIASGCDPREPAGLRVGQRPGLDELWQQRRNDRESGQAKNFGGAYGGNNRYGRSSLGRLSQSHRSHEQNPGWGNRGSGSTIEQGELRSIASS